MAEIQSVKPEATQEQLQEKEKNKEKKEDTPAPQQFEWEFAIKFTKIAKPSQISYLNTVLKEGGFTTLYLQKEKNEGDAKPKEEQEDDRPFLLLKMGDDEVVLSHAEGMRRPLKIFADQEILEKRMKEKKYLPEEVLKAEMKEDFEYKRKDQFDTDIEEGERARVMRFIIYTLKPKKEGIDVIADLGMLQGETIMALYLRKKLIEDCIIFHTDTAKQLVKKTLWSWNVPEYDIRMYYGDRVAMYFAWMEFYTNFLILPGFIGFLIFMFDTYTPDDSPFAGLFSLFICLWSPFFIKFWRRTQQAIKVKWDVFADKFKYEDVRPKFYGEPQVNPITENQELVYPAKARFMKYIKSALISSPFFLIAICLNVIFLNLNGYVGPHEHGTIIHIPFLSQLSEPGQIFDKNGWGTFIPTTFQALIVNRLNVLHCCFALYSTAQENHKSKQSFLNSLVFKRFIFDFMDCFLYLTFIGFYKFDIIGLRTEITALFTIDEIRRVSTETILPFILTKWEARKQKHTLDHFTYELVQFEYEKERYIDFDDYIEIVVQFGYVTLFASAFPGAAFLSVFFNLLEIRSDVFKLAYCHKRPHAQTKKSLGVWLQVMQVMSIACIITNVVLFSFGSDQLRFFAPFLFVSEQSEEILGAVAKQGMGRYVVLITFALEHFMVLFWVLIMVGIKDKPNWVKLFYKRKSYKTKKEALKLKKKNLETILDKGKLLKGFPLKSKE